jgi:hypothetical protein
MAAADVEIARRGFAAVASAGTGGLVDVIDAGDQVVVVLRPPGEPSELRADLTTFRDGKSQRAYMMIPTPIRQTSAPRMSRLSG